VNNNSNSIEYLHLSFEGEGDDSLVDKYIEVLSKITLKSFELTSYEDGGASELFKRMAATDHGWFSSVKTLRIFEIYELKEKEALQDFLTHFKQVHSLRTLCTEQFNPYALMIQQGKGVEEL
jgi:hypothetical protein